jgi:hypothetical protein
LLIPFTAESGETAVLFYPSHSHDDTQRLQTHIDNLTLKNGGEIRFVSGRYRLMGVQAKSNVHLSFSEGVTIEPIPSKGRNIFECGVEKSSISNVAFTGPKKLVLVDFRNDAVKPLETKLRLFMINDCQDFRISNFKIEDNYTLFSSIVLGWSGVKSGKARISKHGVIENIAANKVHYGYGAIQAHAGTDIHFTNIRSTGGVAVRLETGLISMNKSQHGKLDEIRIDNIENRYGQAALLFQAHTMRHGSVIAKNIRSVGSEFAVLLAQPFVSNRRYSNDSQLRPGRFDSIIIDDVQAVFSEGPIITRYNHLKYYPPELQNQLFKCSKKWYRRGYNEPQYRGPSIAAVLNVDSKSRYIDIRNVNARGFRWQKSILTADDLSVAKKIKIAVKEFEHGECAVTV